MQSNDARARTVEDLRRMLSDLESSFRAPPRAAEEAAPSGIDALNAILPEGGFRNGAIVEWLADGEGTGVSTLAFQSVLPWLSKGETCVVIDDGGEFYPAPVTALGIGLEQLLIVRPSPADVAWALEQSLLCRGAPVVVSRLGQTPERVLRRLQLAAETGGGVGVLLRSGGVRGQSSWSHLRLLVSPLPAIGELSGRRLRIEVLHCRGRQSGGVVEVDVDDETGDVRVAAASAAARDVRQAT